MDTQLFQAHTDLVDKQLAELAKLKRSLEASGWNSAATSVSVFQEDGRYVRDLLEELASGHRLPIQSAKVCKMANRWLSRAGEIMQGTSEATDSGRQSFFLQTEQI